MQLALVIEPRLCFGHLIEVAAGLGPESPFRRASGRILDAAAILRDDLAIDSVLTAGNPRWKFFAHDPNGPLRW